MEINYELVKKLAEQKRPCIEENIVEEVVLVASRVNNNVITLKQANEQLLKKEIYLLGLMQTGKVLFEYRGYRWMAFCSPNPEFINIANNMNCELVTLTKQYTKKKSLN